MILVLFKDVRKKYGTIEALRGIDLAVRKGSVVALLGPNGAGKSTLFGSLLGTVLPDSGEILFDGKLITPATRTRFGYLAERVALYPQRTVREHAEYLARLKGIDSPEIDEALERVGLRGLEHRKTSELSKGQLQRTGLAIALAGKPELLVLDEPFNGLDPVVLDVFFGTIREERERGATILISTHTISAAEEVGTDVAVLLDGKLAMAGTLDELRDRFPGDSLEGIYHQIARDWSQLRAEVVPV